MVKRNNTGRRPRRLQGYAVPALYLCAITCQETAYFWLGMSEKMTADEVLARCVLDASGE